MRIVVPLININDRMGDGWPLCADLPNHRGNIEDYPVCIQSFLSFFREKRSNFAQRTPFSSHTFRTLRRSNASYPGLFSFLSPEHHRSVPQRERELMHGQREEDGVPRVCSMPSIAGVVWPPGCTGWYVRDTYHTHHDSRSHPPWCTGYIPTMGG